MTPGRGGVETGSNSVGYPTSHLCIEGLDLKPRPHVGQVDIVQALFRPARSAVRYREARQNMLPSHTQAGAQRLNARRRSKSALPACEQRHTVVEGEIDGQAKQY